MVLDLRYAPEAGDRIREMVRNEQACCPFLTFDLREEPNQIQPDMLFQQFVAAAPAQSACACTVPSRDATSGPAKRPGGKAAALTAITVATGAVTCGACCVLPFALPAAALAGTGSILALFANAHAWVTVPAILAVTGAWGWIATQTVRTRSKPAPSTLYVMVAATALTGVAALWPFIEPQLLRAL